MSAIIITTTPALVLRLVSSALLGAAIGAGIVSTLYEARPVPLEDCVPAGVPLPLALPVCR